MKTQVDSCRPKGSIPEAKAKELAKRFGVGDFQIVEAFNCFDNCVISGEVDTMSVADMGRLFRQCVTRAEAVKDGMVWNDIARFFTNHYDELKRKRW